MLSKRKLPAASAAEKADVNEDSQASGGAPMSNRVRVPQRKKRDQDDESEANGEGGESENRRAQRERELQGLEETSESRSLAKNADDGKGKDK